MPDAPFDLKRPVGLAALAGLLMALAANAASAQPAHQGETIVTRDCIMCHAVGRQGLSQNRRAPPLRELSRRMSPEELRHELTTGITAGHPEMPRLRYDAAQIDAIMAYLRTIQDE
jgi:cytochrome c